MNNYMNNFENNNYFQEVNIDRKLMEKLSKQAGDNMNFNKCGYDGQTCPDNLFDIYNGFIRGNMYPDLYNQYKLSRPFDIRPMNEQAELLTKVDAYAFAAHDVALYLDTHPNDKEMINLYNTLAEDTSKVRGEYEKKFGPLTVSGTEGYPWSWNNSPWPWEK